MKFQLICLVAALALLQLAVAVEAKQGSMQPEGVASASASSPLLANGVWRHGPAERTLIATASEATVTKPGGLSTKGAERAHYATLASDNTYDVSASYCKEHGGELCTVAKICSGDTPIGSSEIPGDVIAYAPVKDGSNSWVQLTTRGDSKKCGVVANPTWGNTKQRPTGFTKNLVPCCNEVKGVLRSYLVPDGVLVDPSIGAKLRKAERTARSAVTAMQKMQADINQIRSQVKTLEASSGASGSTLKEIRDALNMQGSSALVKASRNGGMCCGSTPTGGTSWVQYSTTGIYVDINIASCGYTAVPSIVTSLTGATSHWVSTGTASVYSPHARGFRVYINFVAAMNPSLANSYKWALNWCAKMPN